MIAQAMAIIATVFGDGSDSSRVSSRKALATRKGTGQASKTLPADIYPESGYRLPLPKREDMDEAGQKVYDKLTGSRKRVLTGLRGPSAIRLHVPKLAEKASALSRQLRYESGLSGSIRELAILVAAREMDSHFEWAAHEPKALEEGIPPKVIDVVKYRRDVAGLPETETVIIQLGRQLFGQKKVDSKTFARALKIFGRQELIVLVSLMAQYASTATLLTAFDMQLGPGQKARLP
jgi:4-carboxymuconolactone decarboxylase